LESYPVLVHAGGRDGFDPGPAEAEMSAEIRGRRGIVETLEWSRRVNLVFDGEEPEAAADTARPSGE